MHFSPLAGLVVACLASTVAGSPISVVDTCPAPIIVKPSPSAAPSPAPYVPATTQAAAPAPSVVVSLSSAPVAKPSPAPPASSPAAPPAAPASSPAAKPAASPVASPAASPSPAAPVSAPTSPNANVLAGQATYYGGNLNGGACSFSTYTLPAGIYGTALSSSNWAGSANCGACVAVTGPSGNKITAMIVDECPGCGTNHLDLFPDAFAALANPTKGIIATTWEYVSCPVTGPLSLRNKEGTSRYWFSMEVINAKTAVQSLEVSADGGSTWQSTTRKDYNFFENASGFGVDTMDIKVTAVDGGVVVVKGVAVTAGLEVAASSNF